MGDRGALNSYIAVYIEDIMRSIQGQRNLYLLKGTYYFRRAIPRNLVALFGQNEYKKSLPASTYKQACNRAWMLNLHTSRLFETVTKMVDQNIAPEKIRDFVRNHFEKCLIDAEDALFIEKYVDEAEANSTKAETISGMANASRRKLLALEGLKQSHTHTAHHQKIAQVIIEDAGISCSPTSPDFQQLCDGIVRAQYEAERINHAMLEGRHQDAVIQDPYFAACANSFEKPLDGVLMQYGGLPYYSTSISQNTLSNALEAYKTFKRSQSGKRNQDSQQLLESRLSKLSLMADPQRLISSFTLNDGYALRGLTLRIPKNHKSMSDGEFAAALRSTDDYEQVTVPTKEDYWSIFREFFHFCKKRRWILDNPLEDISLDVTYEPTIERRNFSETELSTLFHSPLFSGHKNAERSRSKPGIVTTKDGNFWLPLIGLYQGMRMGEILGLMKDDMKCENGVWFFDIQRNERRKLKTFNSERKLPVHAELVKLGLVKYLIARQQIITSEGFLFEDGITYPTTQKIIKNYSRGFGKYLDEIGLSDRALVFHSFRHNFCTAMSNTDIPMHVMDALDGRTTGSETASSSRAGYIHLDIRELQTAINKVMPTVDISHLYPAKL